LYRDPNSWLGGVASGLAAYFEIDPVIVRLVWIVALLTGIGIPAYLVCWAVIPKAKSWPPPGYGERSLARDPRSSTLTSGLVIVALAALIGKGVSGLGDLLLPAALIGFGVYLLNQRSSQRDSAGAPPPPPFVADATESPHDGLLGPSGLLTPTVLCLLAIGAGVCWALSAAGVAHFSIVSVAAGGLVIVGLGLIASLWLGRATALIFAGVGLAGVMLVSSAVGAFVHKAQAWTDGSSVPFEVGHLPASMGERVFQPSSLDELQPSYELGMGELTLDLSQLSLGDATRHVQVKLGAGELHVILPPGPSVEAHGRVGVGEATLFDRHQEGAGIDLRASDPGSGQGLLQIDFDLGFGEGTVSHDQ
jgi:phage shock protein PspC (stress-responsive transcriptional regulator)